MATAPTSRGLIPEEDLLFTKEQRRFYADHAPPGVGPDDLTLPGPIFVLKLKVSPERLGGEQQTKTSKALSYFAAAA